MFDKKCNHFRLIWLAALVALITGCGGGDSGDVPEDQIRANIRVFAEGDGDTHVNVQLDEGYSNFWEKLVLAAGDILQASNGSETKDLKQDSGLSNGEPYTTTFSDDAIDTIYSVAFKRENELVTLESSVSLPLGFMLTMPTAGQQFNHDDEITFVWQNDDGSDSGPDAEIQIWIEKKLCILDQWLDPVENLIPAILIETVADTGIYTMAVSELVRSTEVGSAISNEYSCDLNIELIRQVAGELDQNFNGNGGIVGQQIRAVEIQVNPPADDE